MEYYMGIPLKFGNDECQRQEKCLATYVPILKHEAETWTQTRAEMRAVQLQKLNHKREHNKQPKQRPFNERDKTEKRISKKVLNTKTKKIASRGRTRIRQMIQRIKAEHGRNTWSFGKTI